MTDTANVHEQLEDLRRRAKEHPHDKWVARKLEQLEAQVGAYTYQFGKGKGDMYVPEMDTISPEAVQNIEGYVKIDLRDEIMPPTWARNGDPDDGVRISKQRSFGCHRLQNLQETAEQWTKAPHEISEFYGGTFSPRVYLYAGRRMLDQWFMLPTMQLSETLPPYTFGPPVVPYNNTEVDMWKELFVKHHFSGHAMLMGGHKSSHLNYHPLVVSGRAVYKHQMITVANHPQWIMPALNSQYETVAFKQDYFAAAISQLMSMDFNMMAKNEFYEEWQGYANGLGLREYHHEREPTAHKLIPNFQKDPELIT